MEYRILGPLEVRHADRVIPLRGARQRELLAVLLLHANEIVSSDRLIDDLWEGDPPPTATKMIQNGVSQLRKLLESEGAGAAGGEQRLVTRSPGYLLRIGPGELDSDRFERLAAEGRKELAEHAYAAAAERLHEALALWRGPALGDFSDSTFARADAARFEELRCGATEDRIDAELALGRHAAVVAELEALVAHNPLRERLRGQLMLALYRSGRQAEALRVYQETRDALVEELGLEPGPALQRLEKAVLTQDPALELGVEEVRRPSVEPAPVVLPAPETRKMVSVVSADILSLSGPHDPEALRGPMARAVEAVTGVLERHGATTEPSTGGGVIGIFGVPTVNEDDALRAVRAAVEARSALGKLVSDLERDRGITVALRAGVNTGEVVVGNTVAHGLVAGDAVNVAARLQQAAIPGEILVDEQTERLVRDAVSVERVDPAALTALGQMSAWRLLEVSAGAPGYLRRMETPMIGRAEELTRLRQSFERTADERTVQLFTILGPPGIGKTRLAQELVGSLDGRAQVLRGHSLSYGEGITFWPLREVVSQVDGDDPQKALRGVLAGEGDADTIVDRLLGAVGLAGTASSNEETFWAARKLFEALARERPVVLVIDDVHWAEPTFLDLVEHVAEWSTDAPILLLCLGRPELLDARPRWAGGRANVSSALLEPLSGAESEQLIELLLGGRELTPELRDRISKAAEGNPLFIEQMLAMLADNGNGAGRVPPTIQALLAARLERVDADERWAVLRASVMGREFRRTGLEHLSPREERAAIGAALQKLVRRELLRPVRDEVFRFRHLLLREVAYDSLPKQARADLHERFADWLERATEERVTEVEEIVGHHLEQAYRYRAELAPVDAEGRALARRAATRLGAAGRRHYERGDVRAAQATLSRAVALLEPGAPGRAELLADLGEALRETGDFERAETVVAEVIEAASEAGDAVLEARGHLIRLRLRLLTESGASEDVSEEARRLVETFQEAGDERLLAKAWELLAWVPWFRCRAAATDEALQRAIDYARRAGDARTEAQSLNLSVGAAFFGPMPVAEAIRVCEEIRAQPGQQRRIMASALRALAGLKAMAGSFDEARELVVLHRQVVADLGLRVTAASAAETYGIVEMLAGDAAAAERELAWGYGILEEIGESQTFPDLAAKLADSLYAQRRDDRAFELSEVSRQATAPDDLSAGVQWRSVRAKLLARRGETAEAEALAREAVTLAGETDFLVLRADALMDLAEVLRLSGREGECAPVVGQALELYEQKGNVVGVGRARALLADAA
jgi:DNA-binding SARP family transcriptional activator